MYPGESERSNGQLMQKQQQAEAARMAHANGGAMTSGQTPKQPGAASEVSSQFALQDKGLEYLHQQITQLSGLLAPVLVPDAPSATTSSAPATDREQIGSELALHLRNNNDQLAFAVQRIDNLIRRVVL